MLACPIRPPALRVVLVALSLAALGLPGVASAQLSILFTDGRWIGEVSDVSPGSGIESNRRVNLTTTLYGITDLPGGDLVGAAFDGTFYRVDPATFALSVLSASGRRCDDLTIDGRGNLWCTEQGSVYCFNAETFVEAFGYEDATFRFYGIGAWDDRLFAVGARRDDYSQWWVELDPSDGVPLAAEPLDLPPAGESYFWFVDSLDFDDEGGAWLSLGRYFPAVILPMPPDGYIGYSRGAVDAVSFDTLFPFVETSTPSIVVSGTLRQPIDVPVGGPAGHLVLVLALAGAGVLWMRRR